MDNTNESVEEICKNRTLEEIILSVKLYRAYFGILFTITTLVVIMPIWSSLTYSHDWHIIVFASSVFLIPAGKVFKVLREYSTARQKVLFLRSYFKRVERMMEGGIEKYNDWKYIKSMLLDNECVWPVCMHSF